MNKESYKVEVEIKGILSPSRIHQTAEMIEPELFYSEQDTIIKGQISDQSAMTSFMKRIRDSGLDIIEIRCVKSS